jgi:hypothetical protein
MIDSNSNSNNIVSNINIFKSISNEKHMKRVNRGKKEGVRKQGA